MPQRLVLIDPLRDQQILMEIGTEVSARFLPFVQDGKLSAPAKVVVHPGFEFAEVFEIAADAARRVERASEIQAENPQAVEERRHFRGGSPWQEMPFR